MNMIRPYIPDTLPLQSIAWERHVKQLGLANRAVAKYDGILQGVKTPELLLSTLTHQEAILSSKIEGTIANLEEVLEYEANILENKQREGDIKEVLNYRRALRHCIEDMKTKPLRLNLLKEAHDILLRDVRGNTKLPGEFRREQNYIARRLNSPIEEATFIPPELGVMHEALSNLEKYIHYDERDPLVQLAVIHAQFEMIHPFRDGNGRVGRMMLPLFLHEKKLLSSPVFYLSQYLEANRDEYYDALAAVSREKDWNGWIEFFLGAVIAQATLNIEKVQAILGLYEEMKQRVTKVIHSQYSIQTVDALFDGPIFSSPSFIRQSGIPRASALRILRRLSDDGLIVLVEAGKGKRASVYFFPALLEIVNR